MKIVVATTSLMSAQRAVDLLSRACLDSASYRREAMTALRRAVRFEGWSWALIDPASLVPWDVVTDPALAGQQRRAIELDLHEDAVASLAHLVAHNRRVAVLSQLTDGEPARSQRWEELYRPWGVGDELRATLLLDDVCWSYFTLTRDRGRGPFTPPEAAAVRVLLTPLGEGLRRAVKRSPEAGGRSAVTAGGGPGTVVFGPDLRLVSATPMGVEWFRRLRGREDKARRTAALVCALAARLDALEHDDASAKLMPRSRTCTPDGQWLTVHAARLTGAVAASCGMAVVIEPAHPAELLPMALRVHGLSAREREVTGLVLTGRSTQQIAQELFISPYTVQDHLKAVFTKAGVRSRRELLTAFTGDIR